MNPIPITWCLAGAGAAAVLGAWGGWTVRDWKRDSEVLKETVAAGEKLEKATKALNEQATSYETNKQSAATETIERTNTVREIYKAQPVPSDCGLPDSAVGVLNSEIEAANSRASGEPIGTVPAPKETASGR